MTNKSIELKVAVLIPVFNGEKFLEETLRSVFNQDYGSTVVIICNDGSLDGSQKIIERVVEKYGVEAVVLQHDSNLGLSRSLVDLCTTAKQIANVAVILGQDDLLPSDYVRKISRYFVENANAIVSCRALCINETGERITDSQTPPAINFLGRYKTAFLLAANQINAPGVAFNLRFFKPEFVGRENPLTQDWHQWIYASGQASIRVCYSTNVFYRKHSESLTSQGSDYAAHIEISKARMEYLESSQFVEFVSLWNAHQRTSFFALTRFLFREFNLCRHNLEFLEKLAELTLGKPQLQKRTKRVRKCDGRTELTKVDLHRNQLGMKASHKSLLPDSAVVNFTYVTLSTLRLLIGRFVKVTRKRTTSIKDFLEQITIYSTGGLGAQLSALSYAIWLKSRFRRPVKILFHEMGITFYPIVIEDLLVDVPYEVVRWKGNVTQPSLAFYSNVPGQKPHYVNRIKMGVKSILKRVMLPLRVIISEEHLAKESLIQIRRTTRFLKGYHTDWAVINEAWDSLSELISEVREHNFMSNGGTEPTVSVHWRLGDFLNNPSANFTHGTVSAEAILSCLRSIQSEFMFSEVQIFTDSPDVAESTLLAFSSGYHFTFISGDIWEDLFRMSRSQVFIGSHSSISTWAAFSIARANLDSIVYLPSQWFKNEPKGFERGVNSFRNPREIVTNIREYDAKIK